MAGSPLLTKVRLGSFREPAGSRFRDLNDHPEIISENVLLCTVMGIRPTLADTVGSWVRLGKIARRSFAQAV